MDNIIDVHDLPEDDKKILQNFVSFLRNRKNSASPEDIEWNSIVYKSIAEEWENE